MHLTPVLSLLLAGALLLTAPAALAKEASAPAARDVCSALTHKAKKGAKKKKDASAKAHAKGLQALAASIKRLEKHPEDINVGSGGKGITPLMVATALAEEDAIRWLIAHGADPFIMDSDGRDSVGRTQDDAILELLQAGVIDSWADALAHLESIPAKKWPTLTDEWLQNHDSYSREDIDREEVLKNCRKQAQATAEDSGTSKKLVHAFWLMGDTKMFSFMLRHHNKDSQYWEARYLLDTLQPAHCLPMLRLMRAFGVDPEIGHGYYGEILAENPAVAQCLSETLFWQQQLKCGAGAGALNMVKAAIVRGKERAEDDTDLPKAIAEGMGYAIQYGRDNTFQHLFSHGERKGYCSVYAFQAAAETGRSDILKQLVNSKPSKIVGYGGKTVEEALLNAAPFVADTASLETLLQLLQKPLTPEQLQEVLERQAFWKHTDVVKKLLEMGAVPTEQHLKAAKSEYDNISEEKIARIPELVRMLEGAMKK